MEIAINFWDHLKVTIIDANEYYEHTLYGYKSLVEPNIPERSLAPLGNLGVHYYEKMTFK